MAVGLYADVHLPRPVIWQLRIRGVDILAATEEQTNELLDDELLRLATSLSRVVVTQDIRFPSPAPILNKPCKIRGEVNAWITAKQPKCQQKCWRV
ncbi:MAG TPA: DUF5615 family PIN-like protein [Verrucomicrobiae bacterium]